MPVGRTVHPFPARRFEAKKSVSTAAQALGTDAADELGSMVETQIAGDAVERFAGAGLGIGAAVDDERQPGLNDGAGAHRTRFQSDIEGAVFQPPGAKCRRRLGDGDHLGVSGRIEQPFALVVAPGR